MFGWFDLDLISAQLGWCKCIFGLPLSIRSNAKVEYLNAKNANESIYFGAVYLNCECARRMLFDSVIFVEQLRAVVCMFNKSHISKKWIAPMVIDNRKQFFGLSKKKPIWLLEIISCKCENRIILTGLKDVIGIRCCVIWTSHRIVAFFFGIIQFMDIFSCSLLILSKSTNASMSHMKNSFTDKLWERSNVTLTVPRAPPTNNSKTHRQRPLQL